MPVQHLRELLCIIYIFYFFAFDCGNVSIFNLHGIGNAIFAVPAGLCIISFFHMCFGGVLHAADCNLCTCGMHIIYGINYYQYVLYNVCVCVCVCVCVTECVCVCVTV